MSSTTGCRHCRGLCAGAASRCHHCGNWIRKQDYYSTPAEGRSEQHGLLSRAGSRGRGSAVAAASGGPTLIRSCSLADKVWHFWLAVPIAARRHPRRRGRARSLRGPGDQDPLPQQRQLSRGSAGHERRGRLGPGRAGRRAPVRHRSVRGVVPRRGHGPRLRGDDRARPGLRRGRDRVHLGRRSGPGPRGRPQRLGAGQPRLLPAAAAPGAGPARGRRRRPGERPVGQDRRGRARRAARLDVDPGARSVRPAGARGGGPRGPGPRLLRRSQHPRRSRSATGSRRASSASGSRCTR